MNHLEPMEFVRHIATVNEYRRETSGSGLLIETASPEDLQLALWIMCNAIAIAAEHFKPEVVSAARALQLTLSGGKETACQMGVIGEPGREVRGGKA